MWGKGVGPERIRGRRVLLKNRLEKVPEVKKNFVGKPQAIDKNHNQQPQTNDHGINNNKDKSGGKLSKGQS